MIWDAVAAIGQAVSALALIFVILQLRHARSEMRRSIHQARSDALHSDAMMAMDARVLSADMKANSAMGGKRPKFVEALMKDAGVTDEEAQLLFHRYVSAWNTMEPQIHSGAFSPGDRIARDANLRWLCQTHPVGRLWYQNTKPLIHPDAVRYVDQVLARSA